MFLVSNVGHSVLSECQGEAQQTYLHKRSITTFAMILHLMHKYKTLKWWKWEGLEGDWSRGEKQE